MYVYTYLKVKLNPELKNRLCSTKYRIGIPSNRQTMQNIP